MTAEPNIPQIQECKTFGIFKLKQLSDSNGILTHNHLVRQRTLNDSANNFTYLINTTRFLVFFGASIFFKVFSLKFECVLQSFLNTDTVWNVSKYGVFSGLYLPAFTLNTEKWEVSLRIQSECGKIRTRKNFVFGHFSRSVRYHALRSSDQDVFCKNVAPWNFVKLLVKYLYVGPFHNKVARCSNFAKKQVFSSEFTKFDRTPFLWNTHGWLLLFTHVSAEKVTK